MKREHGFTLVEALAAITIFSLVVVALYAGYRVAVRSWETGEHTQAEVADLRLAGDFVRRQLGQAYPLAVADRSAWRLWFHGEPDGVVFATAMPAYLGDGGIYQLALHGERGEDGKRLMVSRRLLHPDAAPGAEGRDQEAPRVLVGNLDDVAFAYYGAAQPDERPRWHERWESMQRLPELVRVRLATRGLGEWPDLVVRLRADGIRYQRSAAPGAPGAQEPSMPGPGLLQ
ncbi:MAG: prepilin-type N-terminal cleavage/methylation domain-containing protein [Gammaproteobacteria bacterium]|nr:prepilin-type N-terminal cleavage/methylation domain-containing protein [Gammaproteobacteria bacterium]